MASKFTMNCSGPNNYLIKLVSQSSEYSIFKIIFQIKPTKNFIPLFNFDIFNFIYKKYI
jgi:hypothetical protein